MENFKEELRSLLRKYSINNDEAVADFLIKSVANLSEFTAKIEDESNDYYLND